MQIEATFRDMKSHRWGFGLRYARCNDSKRLEILLLIAALATVVLWLAGLCAQAQGWARHFQANTERRRQVLSTVFIGQQLLQRHGDQLPFAVSRQALFQLHSLISNAIPP